MGSSLALWRPHGDTGPVTSLAEALDRALRLHGAVAVLLGEVARGGTLAFAELPELPSGFAHESAQAALSYTRAIPPGQEVPEELVISGASHFCLLQTAPLAEGGYAFAHVALIRSGANLALARMELRHLLRDLPPILASQRATLLPRRTSTRSTPTPRRATVPASTLQLILDRLRSL